jgi:hypothetical protein
MKSFLICSFSVANAILIIGIFLLVLQTKVEAQNTEMNTLSNVNLYVDAGFLFAGQVSLNLEKRIAVGEKLTWYGRAGAGFAGVIMAYGGPGGLVAVTMLTGKQNKHFELNGGVFIGKDIEQDDIFVLPLVDFGYRYQKPEGGFIFKAKAGILGVGIGLGYAF